MYPVRSRKLEAFLHAHMVYWVSQDKDEFGETCWHYEDTDELRRVVAEYLHIVETRRRLSNADPKTLGDRIYRSSEKRK